MALCVGDGEEKQDMLQGFNFVVGLGHSDANFKAFDS